MSKFRFTAGRRTDGTKVRVRADIWDACRAMTKPGHTLHGSVQFAEFVGETRAKVTFTNARGQVVTKVLEWDSVRWYNLRNEDIRLEPERRRAYAQARAKAIAELPQGTDERIADAVRPAQDQDAAHHRAFPRMRF